MKHEPTIDRARMPTGLHTRPWVRAAATILTFGALLVLWISRITGSPAEADAAQNVSMAVNLWHEGVISLDSMPPYRPSMYREPLPILLTAVAVGLVDAKMGPAWVNDYMAGDRARILKYQNLVWMVLLSGAVLLSVRVLTGSHYLALIAVLLTSMRLPLVPSGLGADGLRFNTLFTELPAAALMTAASILLSYGMLRGSLRPVAAGGATFGLLALVKASYLYVFVGLIAALPLLRVFMDRQWRAAVREAAVLSVAFAAIVVPWMYRNYEQLGEFQLTERGGIVLYTRAVKNSMRPDEYRASFHFWAPTLLGPTLGRLLGISPSDYELGGRYARLNRRPNANFVEQDNAAELAGRPDLTIAFWRTARAERNRLTMEFQKAGLENPMTQADEVLQERALQMIMDRPVRHLVMTIPFLWRGAFALFPVLLLGLAYALRSGKSHLVAYVLPAFGSVMFYALLSHYIPRYSVPMVPLTIATAVVMGRSLANKVVHRLGLPWAPPAG